MKTSTILHINSSAQTEGSLTRKVSQWLVDNLQKNNEASAIVSRD